MKNYRWSPTYVHSFLFLASAVSANGAVLAEPAPMPLSVKVAAKPTAKRPLADISRGRKVRIYNGAITAIDRVNGVLKVGWPYPHDLGTANIYQISGLVVTHSTQFKRDERGLKLTDIKVGDALLDITHKNFFGKGDNAHLTANDAFTADGLLVKSLNPLTLTIQGSASRSSAPAKHKAGQTKEDEMLAFLDSYVNSNEIEGIGAYVDVSPPDLKTGRWQRRNLIVQEPGKMTFSRSAPAKPLTLGDFSTGQRIAFAGTRRPDGNWDANIIWRILEQPQPTKK